MKLKIKKTGSIIRVNESTWDSLRNKGKGHLYEVVDAPEQPQITEVQPKKRKPRRVEIEDLIHAVDLKDEVETPKTDTDE